MAARTRPRTEPRCHDCLTTNVAVKVIDPCGFEHWFCAEDWAANQELHDKIMAMLQDAATAPGAPDDQAHTTTAERS